MIGRQSSYCDLFSAGQRVVIPAIQRDFAQGRRTEKARVVRAGFIAALHQALVSDGEAVVPLDIDFIYGRRFPADANGTGRFEPLDGQQRLTTLFLLHWLLAVREDRYEAFARFIRVGDESAFSYETRGSARDFFTYLVRHGGDFPPWGDGQSGQRLSPSARIADQPWFVMGWRRDPTVAGCLAMLDELEDRFAGAPPLWDRLISADAPPIVFRLLYLDEFRLSDELYIKMNARGKLLTAFEVFKAGFEAKVEALLRAERCPHGASGQSWRAYVSWAFDTRWTDLLWRFREDELSTLDDRFMHLIRAVALVTRVMEAPEADSRLADDLLALVSKAQPTLDDYEQWSCLGGPLVKTITQLLDHLDGAVDPNGAMPEQALLSRILNGRPAESEGGIRLRDWVEWCAFVAFTMKSPAHLSARREWMRWIRNLARNTEIRSNHLATLLPVIVDQATRLAHGPVLPDIVVSGDLPIFDRRQQSEERLKARLLLRHPGWRALLEGAETHRVFEGCVGFALEFAGVTSAASDAGDWTDDVDGGLQREFRTWWSRVEAIFPPDIAQPREWVQRLGDAGDEWLWERAVLVEGNFLGGEWGQRSLLRVEGPRGWKDALRDDSPVGSAKRRDFVRAVLGRIDPGQVKRSLGTFIAEARLAGRPPVSAGWRHCLVAYPAVLEPCRQGRLHFENGTVHVVHGGHRGGDWTDLFGHCLALSLTARIAAGESSWASARHEAVQGADETPTTTVRAPGVALEATSQGGRFELKLTLRGEAPDPEPFVAAGWTPTGTKTFRRAVSLEAAEAVILSTSELIRA